MRRIGAVLTTLALLALPACAREAGGTEQGTTADEAAIRSLANQYATNWNARDASALSAMLAEDYEDVDPTGRHSVGRAAADSGMQAMMPTVPAGMQMTTATEYVKWLDEDAAIAGGTYHVTGGLPGMPTQGAWMVVAVKRDGSWKVLSSLAAGDLTPMMASDTGTVKREP